MLSHLLRLSPRAHKAGHQQDQRESETTRSRWTRARLMSIRQRDKVAWICACGAAGEGFGSSASTERQERVNGRVERVLWRGAKPNPRSSLRLGVFSCRPMSAAFFMFLAERMRLWTSRDSPDWPARRAPPTKAREALLPPTSRDEATAIEIDVPVMECSSLDPKECCMAPPPLQSPRPAPTPAPSLRLFSRCVISCLGTDHFEAQKNVDAESGTRIESERGEWKSFLRARGSIRFAKM